MLKKGRFPSLLMSFFVTLTIGFTPSLAFGCEELLKGFTRSGGGPTLTESTSKILSEWSIPDGSLAADFVRHAVDGQFVNQKHMRFAQAGLLVQGGGLCNSTCVGAIASTARKLRFFEGAGPELHIQETMNAVAGLTEISGRDARLGSYYVDAETYLKRMVQNNKLPPALRFQINYGIFKLADITPGRGGLILQSVKMYDDEGNAKEAHSIIVLAVNQEQRKVLIFEPNRGALMTMYGREYHQHFDLHEQNNPHMPWASPSFGGLAVNRLKIESLKK